MGIYNWISKHWPWFLLIMACVLFYPFATGTGTVKWDSAEQYFPWRTYISACLHNGEWPLWIPYTLGGYPIHADPQSGAWYLPLWLLSIFGKYNIYTFHAEFVLTVWLAGVGFWKLAKHFIQNTTTLQILSIAYMANGVLIGNAQHLTWVISAAIVPWILWAYVKMLNEKTISSGFVLGLCTWLLITGGYPAYIAILVYILAGQSVWFFIGASQKVKLLKVYISAILVTVLLSLPMLISVIENIAVINRGSGIGLESALGNPFSPQCLISLISPLTTVFEPEFFGTDASMRNAYFGFIPLLFLGFGLLFLPKNKWTIIGLFLGLFMLLVSFGEVTPLRRWLYEYVPMMNFFRFPAVFRLFFMLPFLLIGGRFLENYLEHRATHDSKFKWYITLFLGAFISIIAFILFKKPYIAKDFLSIIIKPAHITEAFLVQIVILSLTLSALLFFYKSIKFDKIVLGLFIVEVCLFSHYNQSHTVVNTEFSAAHIQSQLAKMPAGFPLPDTSSIASHIDENNQDLFPLWQNLNIHRKLVSHWGYNPFVISSFHEFLDSDLKEKVQSHPPVYISNIIDSLDSNISTQNIKYLTFSANTISFEYSQDLEAKVSVTQNYSPYWTLTLDGQAQNLYKENITFMGFESNTSGRHIATLEYKPKLVIYSAYLSAIVLLLIILFLSKPYFLPNKQ